ncbi:MAG TPA: dipeptidase [Longimicrobiales bacterium]|nr:dipeptidase [Longimicrobiales bacterium]
MRPLTAALLLFLAGCTSAPAVSQTPGTAGDEHLATARRVLSAVPLFDGHNDLPWAIRGYDAAPHDVVAYDLRRRTPGHTDIQRLRDGMVGAQFWSIYIPYGAVREGAAKVQLEQIDIAKQIFARYPDVFEETLTPDAALAAFRAGRIASIMGMEGGHAIENSLGALRAFHRLGARYMTLTHSSNIDWADSCCEAPEHGGLTEFGREGVREMNRLGMLVDLSHVSPETMHDALDVTEAPIIFSHSSARGVTDHPRNVPDDVLRRLPRTDGVVMVTFVPSFINTEVMEWGGRPAEQRRAERANAPQATIGDVIAHIEHVRRVAGIDHVGIGADYDGISTTPVGLEDVSTYPVLFAELSRRGWSEAELRKLAGENVLRVWRKAEETRRSLADRPASTATIEALDGPRADARG